MLETIGYDAATAASFAPWDTADAVVARVMRVDRGVASLLSEGGPCRASWGGCLLADIAHDPLAAPAAGDWCVMRTWPDDRATVEHILPRRTAVVRATSGKQAEGQVICANVDLVGVVVSLHPLPAATKIERLLTLAWDSGARPVLLLTKADLVSDAAEVAADVREVAPGVEVIEISVVTGEGLDRVHELLSGRHTMALIGTSGHGKSTLTNALVGAEVLTTRAIRDDGRGRHTSVRRELVVLPAGGVVVDTPGLRSVGLIDVGMGLAGTFADIEKLAAQCRFDDCAHVTEPGCTVRAALEDGTLGLRRWESWQRLRRESAWIASRKAARLRAPRLKDARSRQRDGRRPR
ncbi:MAG: ribosome small subunit-dependent GTPase A [Nocardioides sp.]